jgi:uncharacterized protein YjbJ (UPF0337 family)
MNRDTLEGKWNQLKGQVRKQYGQLTDDDVARIQGDWEKFVGKLQERYGYPRAKAEAEAESFLERLETA